MTRQTRAWQVSLGLHALLIGGFVLLNIGLAATQRPITIDLSFCSLPEQTVAAPVAPPQPATVTPKKVVHKKPAAPVEPPPQIVESVTPELQAAVAPPEDVPLPEESEPPINETVASTPVAESTAAAAPSSEEQVQGYRREHFNYIRSLILMKLDYPPLAQRMGWSGQVVVSFIIREDGEVEEVNVVKSSGRSVLDQSALATIQRVAPFPRPPVAAEIVMPIVYQLN
jgi:protein TonB